MNVNIIIDGGGMNETNVGLITLECIGGGMCFRYTLCDLVSFVSCASMDVR
jgi:hypothetical protein